MELIAVWLMVGFGSLYGCCEHGDEPSRAPQSLRYVSSSSISTRHATAHSGYRLSCFVPHMRRSNDCTQLRPVGRVSKHRCAISIMNNGANYYIERCAWLSCFVSAVMHMYDVNMTMSIACSYRMSVSGSSDRPDVTEKYRILKREMVDMLTALCHTLT